MSKNLCIKRELGAILEKNMELPISITKNYKVFVWVITKCCSDVCDCLTRRINTFNFVILAIFAEFQHIQIARETPNKSHVVDVVVKVHIS